MSHNKALTCAAFGTFKGKIGAGSIVSLIKDK